MDDPWNFEHQWTLQRNLERQVQAGQLPACMTSGHDPCGECVMAGMEICPVAGDSDYKSYLRYLYEYCTEWQAKRTERVASLVEILRRNKTPLHWEYVAKIALQEHSGLFESENSIKGLLFNNPTLFREEKAGVFRLSTGSEG